MIGTLVAKKSGELGIVVGKHSWNNCPDSQHDDYDVYWVTGYTSWLPAVSVRYISKIFSEIYSGIK